MWLFRSYGIFDVAFVCNCLVCRGPKTWGIGSYVFATAGT